jgi:hypothetical protein
MRLKEAYLTCYRVQLNPADLSLTVENFRLASRHPTQGLLQCTKEAINMNLLIKHIKRALSFRQLCDDAIIDHFTV